SLGLYRMILLISASALALSAALVSALVPLDGAQGAAIGTAIAEVAAAVAQAVAVVRGRPQLRPSLRTLPYVAVAAGLALLPMLLTGAPVIARLALSSAVFFAVIALTRAYPPELLDLRPRLRSAGRAGRGGPEGGGSVGGGGPPPD